MAESGERFMRLLLFFDLPTLTKSDRRVANRFRQSLIKDGYHMLQLSVYARLCKGEDVVEKHLKRLKSVIPETGNVRILTVTEKQYSKMEILVGTAKKAEKIDDKQLLLL